MKLKELIKLERPITKKNDEGFDGMLYDLVQAIESNHKYPWGCNFNNVSCFADDDSFNHRVSFKEIYKWHFESDEDSIMRIVLIDDIEIGYVSKSGDTRYWTFQFFLKSYLDSSISFFREVDFRLSDDDFAEDCSIADLEEEHHCQYISLEKLNDSVYIKNFNGFSWALEKFNIPKVGFTLHEGIYMKVEIIEWISDNDYSDDGMIKIKLLDEIVSRPVREVHFNM